MSIATPMILSGGHSSWPNDSGRYSDFCSCIKLDHMGWNRGAMSDHAPGQSRVSGLGRYSMCPWTEPAASPWSSRKLRVGMELLVSFGMCVHVIVSASYLKRQNSWGRKKKNVLKVEDISIGHAFYVSRKPFKIHYEKSAISLSSAFI